MLAQMDLNGNPYLGVFCAVNENYALVPNIISKKEVLKVERALDVKAIKTTIDGSPIIGALLVINSSGAIVPEFINDEEIRNLKKHFNVVKLPGKLNATGNNILVNDKAALVHQKLTKKSMKIIQDSLDVEVLKGTIAGIKTVGSAAIATNKGVLCHPKANEEDILDLKNLFKIDVKIGTVNYGMPLIGAGLIANSKGAITGTNTTGVELNRIEDALGLIE